MLENGPATRYAVLKSKMPANKTRSARTCTVTTARPAAMPQANQDTASPRLRWRWRKNGSRASASATALARRNALSGRRNGLSEWPVKPSGDTNPMIVLMA